MVTWERMQKLVHKEILKARTFPWETLSDKEKVLKMIIELLLTLRTSRYLKILETF